MLNTHFGKHIHGFLANGAPANNERANVGAIKLAHPGIAALSEFAFAVDKRVMKVVFVGHACIPLYFYAGD
jgi:hypothetical protein